MTHGSMVRYKIKGPNPSIWKIPGGIYSYYKMSWHAPQQAPRNAHYKMSPPSLLSHLPYHPGSWWSWMCILYHPSWPPKAQQAAYLIDYWNCLGRPHMPTEIPMESAILLSHLRYPCLNWRKQLLHANRDLGWGWMRMRIDKTILAKQNGFLMPICYKMRLP